MNAIALSAAELTELASCEMVIEHGLKVFHAVGMALLTIREKRLYRADFTTFEAYCEQKWGFTDNYALRLMRGAEVVENITGTLPIGRVLPAGTPPIGGVLPVNEAQVRPLVSLTPDNQRAAWQTAVETAPGGKVTGAHVAQVAQDYKPTKRSGVHFDGAGADPDLDENGEPLTRRGDDDDDEALRVGDIVQYGGQRFTLRSVASSGRVYFDLPKSHKLYGRGIESEDVTLIERKADAKPAAALPPPRAAEEIVRIDGIPVSETHPIGFALFFGGSGYATCVNCNASHPRWSPVRGGDWRCEQPNCKRLTHDDLLIPYTKEDSDAEDRNARRSRAPSNGGHAVHFSSKTDEWYTPPEIIAAVREVMPIELDPASCYEAQNIIHADLYFDAQMNGLHPMRRWQGRVYLNPPYGDQIAKWIERLIAEYKAAHVVEAIALVPARVDTAWYRLLREYPRCHVTGRVQFWNEANPIDGQRTGAPFPSAVFYLGNRLDAFGEAFSTIGDIYTLWSPKS